MIGHLRRMRDRIRAAVQRNAQLAAAVINTATALHYVQTASHPGVPGGTHVSWQQWDGRRWRPARRQEEESD